MSPEMAELAPLAAAWFVVFVFSTTLHEAAHAWAALRLGDPTAYLGGQVSLNPGPHIAREPFGMVVVPLLSFFLLTGGNWMIGWASAPYDPTWAERHPRRSAWMALAGPVSNLLLVLLSGLAIRVGLATGYFVPPEVATTFTDAVVAPGTGAGAQGVATILAVTFLLNLVLFLFNLLPLPPMDGSAVVQLFLSRNAALAYQSFLRQPMWAFVGLLLAWRIFGALFAPLFGFSIGLLYIGV
ncbi:MAG: site-2 protease family protein [Acidobacteriota bacterium]